MTPGEKQIVDELTRRMEWNERRISWTEWRLAQLEKQLGLAPEAAPASPTLQPSPAVPPTGTATEATAPPPVAPPPAATSPAAPAPISRRAFPPAVAPLPAPPRPPPFDWESIIGVRLFAWLGGAALFVAAALFLNYSIQQNLISAPLRVALGLVLGAGALLGGDRLRGKADRAGQALAGAGVATLYASIFAAHSLYHLMSSAVAFAGMMLVTVTAGSLAVKRDAFLVAVLGLLGGFLTPYLLSTGEDRPLALFGYVALLDAGVVAVAARKKWSVLPLLGVAGSGIVFLGWSLEFLDASRAPYALLAAAALAAMFAFTIRGATAEDRSEPPSMLARATGSIAAVLPLLLALAVSGSDSLTVSPAVLVVYLAVLSAGAWFAGRRVEVPLAPVAAGFGAITLAVRVDHSLFPNERLSTLVLFSLLPAAWLGLWLTRRSASAPAADEKMLRISTIIALSACAFLVVMRVCLIEDVRPPVAPVVVYAWVHVAGLVAIGAIVGNSALSLGALALCAAALAAVASGANAGRLVEFVPVTLVPMIAFWSLPLLGPRFRHGLAGWATSALALLVHYPFLYFFARGTWSSGALGAESVACGLLALGTLWVAVRDAAEPRDSVRALLGGVALLFLTAAVPILLSNEWVTVAWALEAAALAWLRGRVKHRGLLIASGLLAGATMLRLLVNPAVLEYHARSGIPFLNWWLYAYGLSAGSLIHASRLLREDDDAKRVRLPEALAVGGGLLVFVLLNIEIADVFSKGQTLTFQFSGGGFGQDMTYTLAWGVYALALFALGMARRSRPLRIWAIALVSITAAKGALHDVWSLGSLYRVVAIVGLAFTLLAVSYLTQRFVLHYDRPERPEPKADAPPAPSPPTDGDA